MVIKPFLLPFNIVLVKVLLIISIYLYLIYGALSIDYVCLSADSHSSLHFSRKRKKEIEFHRREEGSPGTSGFPPEPALDSDRGRE